MLDELLNPNVRDFIKQHEQSDLHQLILTRDKFPGIPVAVAVDQIKSRIKARHKLPEWYSQSQVIFPPPLSMEQCSSEATARSKASLFTGEMALDLTGGAGVDSYYLAQQFKQLIYIEKEPSLSALAGHNFNILGAHNIKVVNLTAETFMSESNGEYDLIYIDPSRRKGDKKVFRWEDLEPDLLSCQFALIDKAKKVMIKGSPLMDIHLAIEQLDQIEQVIVVAVKNEVKELLFIQSKDFNGSITIRASNMSDNRVDEFECIYSSEKQEEINIGEIDNYLYEPNAAIMKSGGFKAIAQQYNLTKLHQHTHLYSSDSQLPYFPGRTFAVLDVIPYDKKQIRKACPGAKANISVRNFPDSVARIREHTGLGDGGNKYLFAFTDYQGRRRVAVCNQMFRT